MADGQTMARLMIHFGVGVASVSTNEVMKTVVVVVSRRFSKGAKADHKHLFIFVPFATSRDHWLLV
jgi:hypothetical protein